MRQIDSQTGTKMKKKYVKSDLSHKADDFSEMNKKSLYTEVENSSHHTGNQSDKKKKKREIRLEDLSQIKTELSSVENPEISHSDSQAGKKKKKKIKSDGFGINSQPVTDDAEITISQAGKKRDKKIKSEDVGFHNVSARSIGSSLHLNSFDDEPMNEYKSSSSKYASEDINSEMEDEPNKKKIKALGSSKGKTSIRQMKREKHAKRQAEVAASVKDQHKLECLQYLYQWKNDKQNWKFMKIKQVWLCKNMFSHDLIPNDYWPILLQYFESAQGGVLKMLLDKAHKIIQVMDEWTESQNQLNTNNDKESVKTPEVSKPDIITYKRARDLIQCLQ